ncbi:MAG: hypothetical protein IT256_06970 [Chitinophagaceae bacterium]|nr:hypothetical protein [Chitinophagaceae bacterium]
MKSTIKLRKILEQYDCTFTINNENQFEVFVATKFGDETGVFTGKSFSVVVGYVYAWMEKKRKSNFKIME